MKYRNTMFAGLTLAFLVGAVLHAASFDWPQWRGPQRTGISKETGLLKAWPTGGPKRVWLYQNAGHGYSGPAIVDGKLYIMGTRDNAEILLALDANTAKELWHAEVSSIYKESRGDGPRGSPAVDGRYVYAMGSLGDLVCASAADGKIVWKHSMEELGGERPHWGYSESPLVDADKVVCTPGGSKGALAAFDKRTGKKIWQSSEFTDDAQYASIIPVDLNGARQYIQLTQQSLAGIAAKDGKLLWRSPWPGRVAVIPTPIYHDHHVYITSGYGVGCKLVKIGPNNDVSTVYENKVMKNHHGGVVLVGGYLYGHADPGWTCQNFSTGEEMWNHRRFGKGAVACAEGMLYCVEESSGNVALVEASPEGWRERGQFKLEPQSQIRSSQGRVWTHPVISQGKLYLRDQELIYCYDVREEPSQSR